MKFRMRCDVHILEIHCNFRYINLNISPRSDTAGNVLRKLVDGGILLVPQFTLAADTRKGNRPGFSRAADAEHGQAMFEELCGAVGSGDGDHFAGPCIQGRGDPPDRATLATGIPPLEHQDRRDLSLPGL